MNGNSSNRVVCTLGSHVPLVVFFGPHDSGKTMTMVRMVRFLLSNGYVVKPVRTLRPDEDTFYEEKCKNFLEIVHDDHLANQWGFMLIEILKSGCPICQMLDIPGGFCHLPHYPKAGFPDFFNEIFTSSNPIIWTIMVEPDWMNHSVRADYVSKIYRLKLSMRAKDSVLFVLNKIDKTEFVKSVGRIDTTSSKSYVKDSYPDIFLPFENRHPISRFWRKYNFDFVPFQTGYYTEAVNGLTYLEGPREYCVKLWKCIMSRTAY